MSSLAPLGGGDRRKGGRATPLLMLRARRFRVQETPEETSAGMEKEDIAITPLAVPLLSGPGAISTVILLRGQARDLSQHIALTVCIIAVACVSFVVLRISARGARWMTPIAMKITARLMGLLLAAIACQFFVNALTRLSHTRVIQIA